MHPAKVKDLERQGYRLAGEHSAVKVCLWAKRSAKGRGSCYKNRFYGISSHRCVQMTPALPFCTLRCEWCWRDIAHTVPRWTGPASSPKEIVDGCIREHVKLMQGFKGDSQVADSVKAEIDSPKHFAISLAGEPTLYPDIPGLVDELSSRGLTSFLVTNGTRPEVLERLLSHPPTQLYLTLPAPNKQVFESSCAPLIPDAWENILRSLEVLSGFEGKTRTVVRLTLTAGSNMTDVEGYARLIRIARPTFVECKAYVWVGYSKQRLGIGSMPSHAQIRSFGLELAALVGKELSDEQKESRVVLLTRSA